MVEEIRFSKEVLAQINARRQALSSINILNQMAARELTFYLNECLESIGLDSKKEYRVDEQTGVIKTVTTEILTKNLPEKTVKKKE